jgi:methylase of polypeptide subunit release factors
MRGSTSQHTHDRKLTTFPMDVAPGLLDLYEANPLSRTKKSILDLCCGTGQLVLQFLDRGYDVTGVDLSDDMLSCARRSAARYRCFRHQVLLGST